MRHGRALGLVIAVAALTAVDAARHVRAIVYLDAELRHVSKADAPGINAYHQSLGKLLAGRRVQKPPHEHIIARLDEAGETLRILILRTDLALPYTSVVLQLDCGYWSAEAEKKLRDAIGEAK